MRSGYSRGLNRDQIVKIARLTGCKNFVGTAVTKRSFGLYSMRSLTLRQWRDLKMGVIYEDLGALTTE